MMEAGLPDPETFLSGDSGQVSGRRHVPLRRAGDRLLDLRRRLGRADLVLDALAAQAPAREVLVVGVYRPASRRAAAIAEELRRSRHGVRLALGSTGEARTELASCTVASSLGGGKFQNLNAIRRAVPGEAHWTLVVDDDVVLPKRFLDRFIGVTEHFGMALAQPAQTLSSHAAWRVTRRRGGSLVRETRFVEIGPVTAFRADAAAALMPFPDLRFGWGLDLHWAAVAAERGWRVGVVDALPVRHEDAPVATSYAHADAVAEARSFLAERRYLPSAAAGETLARHRRPLR